MRIIVVQCSIHENNVLDSFRASGATSDVSPRCFWTLHLGHCPPGSGLLNRSPPDCFDDFTVQLDGGKVYSTVYSVRL